MARSGSAARRYAEAAFELATRDGVLDAWQDGLALAVSLLGDAGVARIAGDSAAACPALAALAGVPAAAAGAPGAAGAAVAT